eukprot:9553596-Alexandrium_andersonii.AAC.2
MVAACGKSGRLWPPCLLDTHYVQSGHGRAFEEELKPSRILALERLLRCRGPSRMLDFKREDISRGNSELQAMRLHWRGPL